MPVIVSLNPVELRPGANQADFERLVREDLARLCRALRQDLYLMKGDRGARDRLYMLKSTAKSSAANAVVCRGLTT